MLGTPKSHQSRAVPVPQFIAAELAVAITGLGPDALAFTMPGGSVVRLSNWRRAVFLPARARAGLSDRLRVHDLRHTAASLMIQAGYPPKMLQEIMGHASITTTLDLYGHLYPGDMDRYADRLNEAAGMMRGYGHPRTASSQPCPRSRPRTLSSHPESDIGDWTDVPTISLRAVDPQFQMG